MYKHVFCMQCENVCKHEFASLFCVCARCNFDVCKVFLSLANTRTHFQRYPNLPGWDTSPFEASFNDYFRKNVATSITVPASDSLNCSVARYKLIALQRHYRDSTSRCERIPSMPSNKVTYPDRTLHGGMFGITIHKSMLLVLSSVFN